METRQLLMLVATVALLALDGVHAATESSTSGSAANDTTVLDSCSDEMWSYGCEYLVPCRVCLEKEVRKEIGTRAYTCNTYHLVVCVLLGLRD